MKAKLKMKSEYDIKQVTILENDRHELWKEINKFQLSRSDFFMNEEIVGKSSGEVIDADHSLGWHIRIPPDYQHHIGFLFIEEYPIGFLLTYGPTSIGSWEKIDEIVSSLFDYLLEAGIEFRPKKKISYSKRLLEDLPSILYLPGRVDPCKEMLPEKPEFG